MRNDKENIIVEKSFQFALEVVIYCEILEENRKYVLSRQLLRAGTSIGANVREAQNAESKADFIHKIKLAAKEADETEYWPHFQIFKLSHFQISIFIFKFSNCLIFKLNNYGNNETTFIF